MILKDVSTFEHLKYRFLKNIKKIFRRIENFKTNRIREKPRLQIKKNPPNVISYLLFKSSVKT